MISTFVFKWATRITSLGNAPFLLKTNFCVASLVNSADCDTVLHEIFFRRSRSVTSTTGPLHAECIPHETRRSICVFVYDGARLDAYLEAGPDEERGPVTMPGPDGRRHPDQRDGRRNEMTQDIAYPMRSVSTISRQLGQA